MSEFEAKTPAGRFIARFGVKRLAHWSGRHASRVHAWSWPVSKGGTGGVIPIRVRQRIIDGAKSELGEHVGHVDFEPVAGEAYLGEPVQ